jgi:hypothetical protein
MLGKIQEIKKFHRRCWYDVKNTVCIVEFCLVQGGRIRGRPEGNFKNVSNTYI